MKHQVCSTLLMHTIVVLTYSTQMIFGKLYTDITPAQMILNENYPSETHFVTTEDGYILTVYRIPGLPGSIPVFMQHGIFESSADYLESGRNRSLAYILSDMGYDVWLGNARGNTYSKMHTTLTISDPEFWDFSWNELGIYDIPASVMYVFNLTNEKMFYVGHSMGVASFAVMASEKPEIAQNIRAMIALAPGIYNFYIKQPVLKIVAPFWKEVQFFGELFGIKEVLGRNAIFDYLGNHICPVFGIGNFLCSNIIFFIGGFDKDQFDYKLVPNIVSKVPAGTSLKIFIHWLQQMAVPKFRNFNYGSKNNWKVYNSSEPPNYDITKIQVPLAVFYSDNDWIESPKDAEHFYNQVPNKLGIYKINHPYTHFDFLWGVNASQLVYPAIFDIFARFSN